MFPFSVRAPKPGFAVITLGLILINLYFFFGEISSPDPDAFIQQFALIPSQINFSSWANLTPFISAQFLHAGLVHLISNMWFLFLFGPTLEKALGKVPFIIFYLAAGFVGFFLEFLFLAGSAIPVLGASGAIARVLGGFLAFYPKAKVKVLVPIFPLFLPISFSAQFVLIYWFVIQLFSGTAAIVTASASTGGVAWWAHVGGFGLGYLIGKAWPFPKPLQKYS